MTQAAGQESLEMFRARLRAWLAEHLGPQLGHPADHATRRANSMAMYAAGLSGLTWPTEYGGRDLPTAYQTVSNEETRDFLSVLLNPTVTIGICARVLLDVGTAGQKARYLPRMLSGEQSWTQLLSEPGAGSDLASVSTFAERVGDDFVLDGQKVWTSGAQDADLALALVRTDREQRRQAGLSMLIVDMTTPGIDVRPLREMTGSAVFNEVFIDTARVPVANLLGTPSDGWSILTTMLTHERIALSAGTVGGRMDQDAFAALLALARAGGAIDEPHVRDGLADVYIQQRLLDLVGQRIRAALDAGVQPGPVGSLGKVGTARAARAAAETAMSIGGLSAQAWADETPLAVELLLSFPKNGIAGGTTEIQKNMIAERLLGLPREPKP